MGFLKGLIKLALAKKVFGMITGNRDDKARGSRSRGRSPGGRSSGRRSSGRR